MMNERDEHANANECLSSREQYPVEDWESIRGKAKGWEDIVVCVLQSICRRLLRVLNSGVSEISHQRHFFLDMMPVGNGI